MQSILWGSKKRKVKIKFKRKRRVIMYRMLSPNGKLLTSKKIEPVVENVIKINGKQQRLSEIAEGFKNEPNAILIFNDTELTHEQLYIGNLKPAKVKEIMVSLLQDGYYDFSQMQYQDTKKVNTLVFDNGESLPYSSEITPLSIPVGLSYKKYDAFGSSCIDSISDFEFNEDDDSEEVDFD